MLHVMFIGPTAASTNAFSCIQLLPDARHSSILRQENCTNVVPRVVHIPVWTDTM